MRFVDAGQEGSKIRRLDELADRQDKLEQKLVALEAVELSVRDERKSFAKVRERLAVANDRLETVSKNIDQVNVDLAIIHRHADSENKVHLELRELVDEVRLSGAKNRSFIKEYQDEALKLRGDFTQLDEKIDLFKEELKRLSELAVSLKKAETPVSPAVLTRESVKNINANSKRVADLSNIVKGFGKKVGTSLDNQTARIALLEKKLNGLAGQIVEIRQALKRPAKTGATLKSDKVRPGPDVVSVTSGMEGKTVPATGQERVVDKAVVAGAGVKQQAGVVDSGVKSKLSELDLYSAANKLYLDNQYNKAVPYFDDFLLAYPASKLKLDAMYKLGRSLFELKRLEEALEMFDNIILIADSAGDEKSMVATAMLRKSIIFLEMGQHDNAEKNLKAVISKFPNQKEAASAREILVKITE